MRIPPSLTVPGFGISSTAAGLPTSIVVLCVLAMVLCVLVPPILNCLTKGCPVNDL